MPRRDRTLGNNLLANRPDPPPVPYLPAADLDFDTPHTGTLSFECDSSELLDLVAIHLQAERPSALLDDDGGRVFIAARGEIVPPDRFPSRVAIPVEVIDDPGPVEL